MPWATPLLSEVRKLVRDHIAGSLPGADATVPNSVLRVMADANAGLAHLTLLYIDWLADQIMIDTAETEWLDRFAVIWLPEGRKSATFATGEVTATGANGTVVPLAALLTGSNGIEYETLAEIVIGAEATSVNVRALDPGVIGNVETGQTLDFQDVPVGANSSVTVVSPGIGGGVDVESDELLRARVLERVRQPPMGGAAHDYVAWAKAVPGVTRAWAAAEQGPGTITVRFLMDELRAVDDGWPLAEDLQTVADYIDQKRPVTVMDTYVVAPIKEFVAITISNLLPNTVAVKAAIEASLESMLFVKASPGQTIYEAWISYAIMTAPGVQSFNLVTEGDFVMPSIGHMAVLGTLTFND